MTLRWRLFLLFGGLVALLVAGQWWLVRTLSRDLAGEVGNVAVSVGRSLLTVVGGEEVGEDAAEPGAGAPRKVDRRVTVIRQGDDEARAGVHEFYFRVAERPAGAPAHAAQGEAAVDPLGEAPGAMTGAMTAQVEVAAPGGAPAKTHVVLKLDDDRRGLRVEGDGAARVIPLPASGVEDRVGRFGQRLLLGSLGLLALGLLVAAVVAHRVSSPLAALASAARRVGQGELGVQSPAPRDPEVGEAVRAFNRMSAELAQHAAEAREREEREHLAELGEVARGLAHTLRNPLNALGLTVDELAAGGAHGEEGHRLAETARRQIRRMDQSVRALLVLAADGPGGATTIDLRALAEDVVLEILQEGRERARLRVEPAAEGAAAPRVSGVPAELRAMLQALVVNAVEASPPEGSVVVGVEARDGSVQVTVEDAGPGLAPEVRARLFAAHVSTKPTGSGMGLFLCHRLATSRYGGSLELADRDGGGTSARLVVRDRAERRQRSEHAAA